MSPLYMLLPTSVRCKSLNAVVFVYFGVRLVTRLRDELSWCGFMETGSKGLILWPGSFEYKH